MNTGIKNGKKPLNSKPTRPLTEDSVFGSPLDIPESIKQELEAKGLSARWIDAQDLYKSGGYHKRGWQAYVRKIDTSATMDSSEFRLGRDPEGVIRRGSLILGVRSKEQSAQHRELLRQKNARLAQGVQKEEAQKLQQFARQADLNAKVHTGYDDENNE